MRRWRQAGVRRLYPTDRSSRTAGALAGWPTTVTRIAVKTRYPGAVAVIDSRAATPSNHLASFGWAGRQGSAANRKSR